MINKKEKIQYICTLFADVLSLISSVSIICFLGVWVLKKITGYMASDWTESLGLLAIAFLATSILFGQDNNIMRHSHWKEIIYAIKFNVLMSILYVFLMVLVKASMISVRTIMFGIPVCNICIMPIMHELFARILLHNQGKSKFETLIGLITTRERAEKLIEAVGADWSNRICGIVLLEETESAIGQKIGEVTIQANYDTYMEWIRRAALDEVYVDLPMDSGKSFLPCLKEINSMGLTVHCRMPLLDQITKVCCDAGSTAKIQQEVECFAGQNVLTIRTVEFKLHDMIIKRIIDICGGLVGCILSLPIIAIVAIPLKLESPGPLIFKQKRVGRNGRYFYIHKLRSMYMDAEERKKELMSQNEMTGLMFKMEDDPRITKVGRILRKTSIDELPQFFDVLRGDMSLVGTRPPTVDEYKQYESHHKRRLSMKPGITGMWQVSGRSDIEDFEDVVRLDAEYIDTWSPWLDIKILFKTLKVVLLGRGAR